jgi:hypothetical protein
MGIGFSTPILRSAHSTTFNATENPLSEGGLWSTPADRTAVRQASGRAYGTMAGGGYDDSIAMLAGSWSPDVEIITTVYKGSPVVNYQEIEHIHRCAAAGTYYEINFAHDGAYCDFIRAEGGVTLGDYTYLIATGTFSIPGGAVNHGDLIRSRMIGDTLTAWIDRGGGYTLIGSASDTSLDGHAKYASGKPGIGYFKTEVSSDMSQYGFSTFSAVCL